MFQKIVFLLLAISLIGGGCVAAPINNQNESGSMDNTTPTVMAPKDATMDKEIMDMEKSIFDYSGKLEDVAEGNSTGDAMAGFANGKYMLKATFENLPELEAGYFYEGWIVRKSVRFSVISTGPTEIIDGKHINTWNADKDLTDHTFYVLTLEPDDGDPAPAAHILEGTMTLVK